jgi:hypothetical protein
MCGFTQFDIERAGSGALCKLQMMSFWSSTMCGFAQFDIDDACFRIFVHCCYAGLQLPVREADEVTWYVVLSHPDF